MIISKAIHAVPALTLVMGLFLTAADAQAERAGVAAAVNTQTQGKPPGGTIRQIVLGQDVLHNEEIKTDANGQAQILMLDRTALTIGPNTTLVIDQFIYDPATKSGDMKLTLSRGLMRFTGGALSKEKAVNVRTPVATVGIRGGMGLIEVPSDSRMNAGFLFGDEMTVSIGSTVAQRIERPGFGTNVSGGEASAPRRWDSEKVGGLMRKLQGGAGRTGGLARQPGARSTNQALNDSLPPQDGKALNDTINQVLSNTEILQSGEISSVYNTANQNRPYNDLPPEQPPTTGWDDYCAISGCMLPFPGEGPFNLPHFAIQFFLWLGSHQDIPDYDRNFTQAETVDWLTANQAKFTEFYTPEQIQDWLVNNSGIDIATQHSLEQSQKWIRQPRSGAGAGGMAGGNAIPQPKSSGWAKPEGVVETRLPGHGGWQTR